MNVKTKEDALVILNDIADRKGLPGASFAAQHVIENYQDYDYEGSDILFLAYCEELIEDITLSPEAMEQIANSLDNPSKPNKALVEAMEDGRDKN